MSEEKPRGSRLKPPRYPPTAIGTSPPEGRAPSKFRRIISFLSARRGVGKSTVAFYSAVAWADRASCQVLYVPFDFAAGEKYRRRLGLDTAQKPQSGSTEPIEISRHGVGVLQLTSDRVGWSSIHHQDALQFLVNLNRRYDLFIDIDLDYFETSPRGGTAMGESLLEMSDHAFFITTARKSFFHRDLKGLRRLRTLDPERAKVDLAVNRVGASGLSESEALRRLTAALGTKQIFLIPELHGLDSWSLDRAADNPKYNAAFLPLLSKLEAVGTRQSQDIVQLAFEKEEDIAVALSKRLDVPYASPKAAMIAVQSAQAVSLVNAILKQSLIEHASDVLVESCSELVRVRFRLNGTLHDRAAPPKSLFNAIACRIKLLARLDAAERRRPQEGRFSIKIQSRIIAVHVSTMATAQGERVVLRLKPA